MDGPGAGAGSSILDANGQPRLCKCELTAVQRTVSKEGPNTGRSFWVCPNSEGARCGYFEWEDAGPGGGSGPGSGGGRGGGGMSQGGGQSGECYKVRPSCLLGSVLLSVVNGLQCHQEGHWASGVFPPASGLKDGD